jgi:hypothetical protein
MEQLPHIRRPDRRFASATRRFFGASVQALALQRAVLLAPSRRAPLEVSMSENRTQRCQPTSLHGTSPVSI